MGIKVNKMKFKFSDETKDKSLRNIMRAAVNQVSYVAENACTAARKQGSYHDDTGNLRSSIGYVIVADGKVKVGKPEKYKNGDEGIVESKKLLDKLANNRVGDIDLHIVAGMDYADYVERIHHKTVLSPARVYVDRELPYMLEAIGLKKTNK